MLGLCDIIKSAFRRAWFRRELEMARASRKFEAAKEAAFFAWGPDDDRKDEEHRARIAEIREGRKAARAKLRRLRRRVTDG